MHRTIQATVAPAASEQLCCDLAQMDAVVQLSLERGVSLKLEGDVVTIHALNRGIDHVFHRLNAAREHGPLSITTSENASIIDAEQQEQIDNDVDEAIWEEAETGLRHQGGITANFVTLMALGGAIAATGLVAESVPQTIAFVAASIIAPGFEPIAKVPLGVVLGRWAVVRRGVLATVVGYAVLEGV